MFILYNRQLLNSDALLLPITDRAFQYNDGFFETIILLDGQLRFWQDHQHRMQEAAAALQLDLPKYFLDGELEQLLLHLAGLEKANACGRLKIKVWRSGAGLYTPEKYDINWMATIEPTNSVTTAAMQISVCQQVKTAPSALSHFKGPNAPIYVLAGLEKKQKQHEDMLLLSPEGHVAELISSNFFWLKDGVLYTAALQSGCVNGIVRRNILRWCNTKEITVKEVLQEPEKIRQAEAVFAANVTGIRGIASIDGIPLKQQEAYLQQLRQDLTFA